MVNQDGLNWALERKRGERGNRGKHGFQTDPKVLVTLVHELLASQEDNFILSRAKNAVLESIWYLIKRTAQNVVVLL